jgi:hypothetical protein
LLDFGYTDGSAQEVVPVVWVEIQTSIMSGLWLPMGAC